jgi:hypothetical protein
MNIYRFLEGNISQKSDHLKSWKDTELAFYMI